MSLQTGIFKTENRFQALFLALISLILAVLSIFILIQIFGVLGLPYDINEIIQHSVISQLFNTTNLEIFTNNFFNLSTLLNLDSWLGIFNWTNIILIIYWATPLILTGLAVAIPFKAGLFNIGGQGQMILGGVFAGIWAAVIVPNTPFLSFLDTPYLMIPSTIVVSFCFGAIWGAIPGLLRAYFGAHEVIVTILLNQIALNLASYLVGSANSPFVQKKLAPNQPNAYGQTDEIIESAKILPIFSNNQELANLNWAIIIVLVVVLIAYIFVFRTNFGFKIRATGFNRTAAEVSGVNTKKTIFLTMLVSGGVAGLAGGFNVMSQSPYRYIYSRDTGTVGFDGIAVSLIGLNNPFPIVLAALLFGLLRQARFNLDLKTNINSDLIVNLQAIVILFTAAPLLSRKIYNTIILPRKIRNGEKTQSETFQELRNWLFYNKRSIFYAISIVVIPVAMFLIFSSMKILIFDINADADESNDGILSIFHGIGTRLNSIGKFIIPYLTLLALILFLYVIAKFMRNFVTENRAKGNSVSLIILKATILIGILLQIFIAFLYVLVIISYEFIDPIDFYFKVMGVMFASNTIKAMLIASFPIIMAAIGGTINERVGVINIGLEGILLLSAFASVYVTAGTGSPYFGILGGVFVGTLVAFLHAIFTITLKAEHIVTGVGINLLALGLTDFLTAEIWGGSRSDAILKLDFLNFLPFAGIVKTPLADLFAIPILGDVFFILSRQSILFFIGILIIPLIHILLFKTSFGLRMRVIGEEPKAAATAGIHVKKYQYIGVMLSGAITSIGGVFLAIGDSNSFQSNMTGGRGFTALAAMIFGKWTVIGSTLTGLFFGYFYGLAIALKSFAFFENIYEILTMIPFVIAILVLAGAIGLARPPKSLGNAYDPQD